jgi:hypothetical protein
MSDLVTKASLINTVGAIPLLPFLLKTSTKRNTKREVGTGIFTLMIQRSIGATGHNLIFQSLSRKG